MHLQFTHEFLYPITKPLTLSYDHTSEIGRDPDVTEDSYLFIEDPY